MMRITDRVIVGAAVTILGASIANAQAGSGQPAPGSGNSTQITAGNRDNNAGYNHVVGSGVKSQVIDDRPAPKKPGVAAAATAADIKAGSGLRDSQGVKLGTIDSVDADGAVVNTGQTKIKVPLTAFGKDDQGLLLGITAARFNELVAKAQSSH
jgi:hypothetical protein